MRLRKICFDCDKVKSVGEMEAIDGRILRPVGEKKAIKIYLCEVCRKGVTERVDDKKYKIVSDFYNREKK